MQCGYDAELSMEDGCVRRGTPSPSPDPDETQGGVDTEAQTCLLTIQLHKIKTSTLLFYSVWSTNALW